jgi:hypothetical protein
MRMARRPNASRHWLSAGVHVIDSRCRTPIAACPRAVVVIMWTGHNDPSDVELSGSVIR